MLFLLQWQQVSSPPAEMCTPNVNFPTIDRSFFWWPPISIPWCFLASWRCCQLDNKLAVYWLLLYTTITISLVRLVVNWLYISSFWPCSTAVCRSAQWAMPLCPWSQGVVPNVCLFASILIPHHPAELTSPNEKPVFWYILASGPHWPSGSPSLSFHSPCFLTFGADTAIWHR